MSLIGFLLARKRTVETADIPRSRARRQVHTVKWDSLQSKAMAILFRAVAVVLTLPFAFASVAQVYVPAVSSPEVILFLKSGEGEVRARQGWHGLYLVKK